MTTKFEILAMFHRVIPKSSNLLFGFLVDGQLVDGAYPSNPFLGLKKKFIFSSLVSSFQQDLLCLRP